MYVNSLFPIVANVQKRLACCYKTKTIFEGNRDVLNWHVLVNRKLPEDVIPGLETGGMRLAW